MTALTIIISLLLSQVQSSSHQKAEGAWQAHDQDGNTLILILADGHYSLTAYDLSKKTFASTRGGKYKTENDALVEMVEFNTLEPQQVGTEVRVLTWSKKGNEVSLTGPAGLVFSRVDDGGPGKLAGAWVITGRMSNGELRTMTPGARRTMKILSGSRFQWIAYNVDTKDLSGTGGGTYTTVDGKYTENIEFFSRDNSRVGASLSFEFAIGNKTWRHKGLSSKGEPIDEVWSRRSEIGL